MATAETVRQGAQLALPFQPSMSAWTDMRVWFEARIRGWDPDRWCTPPAASVLADGWREDAERWIVTVTQRAG